MAPKYLYLAPVLFALSGCADDTTPTGTTGPVTGTDVNPNGVAYPADNHGYVVGAIVPNLKFMGWRDGDTSGPATQISLANYFDPDGTDFKLIHIQAAARWCGPCQQEASAAAPLNQELRDEGAIWLTVIVDGATPGGGATLNDVQRWVKSFGIQAPSMLDSDQAKLGPFFPGAAVPWNGTIDAHTMKVLESQVGGEGYETAANIRATMKKWLTKVGP